MTIAKYLRISDEDTDLKSAGKAESNSIVNQRNLLDTFISQHNDFAHADVTEFCDDGWSGKNFERPGVQAMLEQVKRGKIQCIIVKDLSRFGRDYLIVGNYISKIFPFMGVRFIAINDGLDSSRPEDVDSLDTSFKALLYDLYSRDLSRKVRSAKRLRAQRGDFMSPFAPYGYMKDPMNHSRLVIDMPAAEVVRRIFKMIANGNDSVTVARMLNDEAVLTPMCYKLAAGCSRTRWPSVREDNFWTATHITNIIRDVRYIGTNTYGKRLRDAVGSDHTVKVNRSDWITVAGTHEGVVSRDEFERAQATLREYRERIICRNGYLLSGKIRCGVCGHILKRSDGKEKYFYCRTMKVVSNVDCIEVHISESDLLFEILTSLHTQAALAVEKEKILAEQRKAAQRNLNDIAKRLSALQDAQTLRERQGRELYEAFVLGNISKSDYLAQKSALSSQNERAVAQIIDLQSVLNVSHKSPEDEFIEKFKRLGSAKEVTDEIVRELLKEVRVYPHGRLEVVWNYSDPHIHT